MLHFQKIRYLANDTNVSLFIMLREHYLMAMDTLSISISGFFSNMSQQRPVQTAQLVVLPLSLFSLAKTLFVDSEDALHITTQCCNRWEKIYVTGLKITFDKVHDE